MFAALKSAAGAAAKTAVAKAKTTVGASVKGAVGASVKGAAPTLSVAGMQAAAAKKAQEAALTATLGKDGAAAAKTLQAATGTNTTGALASMKTFFGTTLPATAAATGIWVLGGLNPMNPATWTQRIVVYLPIICGLVFLIWYIGSSRGWFTFRNAQANKAEAIGGALNASAANAPAAKKEGFVDAPPPVSPDTYTLVNLQPRTIKQTGFIGPLPEGSFDTTATAQALRAGFRSFVFQIDYLDTDRGDKFPEPGVPALLYRGDDGSLLSTNSADINEVAQSIANLAFRPEVPNYSEPLIIYLHVLRTPSVIRDPDGYKVFLSKIAAALNPLAPNHLGMTPLGTFNRQKQESTLINTPLSSFEGQVIILCNADTSIFRTAKGVDPANDLDFWVNMRVYLHYTGDKLGVTQAPPAGITPSAVVVGLNSILSLSPEKADAFAAQAKSQFVIAITQQLSNPSPEDLNKAINTLGVNVVPIDIFSDPIEKTHALVAEYSNMTFRPKPAGLRNA